MSFKVRIIAITLCILVIFSTLCPVSFAEYTVEAQMSAQASPYAVQEVVTTEELFTLYPLFMTPDVEVNLFNLYMDSYLQLLNDYSGSSSNVFLAAAIEALADGKEIIFKELTSSMGWGTSYQEEISEDAMAVIQNAVFTSSSVIEQAVENVSSSFSNLKDIYDISTEVGKNEFINDMKNSATHLSDQEIDEMADEMFGASGKLLSITSDGIKLAQMATTYYMLQEIEFESIMTIVQQLDDNSELKTQLIHLMERKRVTLLETFANTYLRDAAMKAVEGFVKRLIVSGSTPLMSIASFSLNFYYEHLYSGTKASEVAKLLLIYTYSTDLKTAVETRKMYFRNCQANHQTISEEAINDYLLLYTAMLASQKAILTYANKLDTSAESIINRNNIISIYDTFTTNKYLELCKSSVQNAIEKGIVVAPDHAEDPSNTSTVTKEESILSIQEKFRQIQEKYPPNQGEAFTGSFGGCRQCYGFARLVFNRLFDCDMPSAYYNAKRYEYVNTNNVVLLGQLEGTVEVTEASVKSLLSQAMLGDIIQACGKSQHTMVVVEADDTGIVLYDANSQGDNIIRQTRKSYAEMATLYSQQHSSSESGLSLYRAACYNSLYWDGSAVFYDDSVNYVIQNGVLTAYNGWQRHLVVPDGVTEIADRVFYGKDIDTVVIPEGVKKIGEAAFQNCKSLYYVELSDDLESIGSHAFQGCSSLPGIVITGPVTIVDEYTFNSCTSLRYIAFPETLTTIGTSAFEGCTSLEKIELPEDLKSIEYAAFSNTGLVELVLPNSVTTIGNRAFSDCSSLERLTLSKGLQSLGSTAFGESKISEVVIPKSLESANAYVAGGGGPFHNVDTLKNVTFEEGTDHIAQSLFAGCTGLEEIRIPDTVTLIDEGAFSYCPNLSSVVLSANLSEIGYYAFGASGVVSVTIPDSVTEIGNRAFSDCNSLAQVKLSKGLRSLGSTAFGGSQISEIVIPKSLETANAYATGGGGPFDNVATLKKVSFEEGTEHVAAYLFAGCTGLEEIVVPDSVTTIGEGAFRECTSLKKIDLPNNLITIESYAFQKCTALTEVRFPEQLQNIWLAAFEESGLKTVTLPDSATSIGNSIFSKCASLTEVTLSGNLSKISSNMFYGCPLTEIEIPQGVQEIQDYAFRDCTELLSVTLPSSLRTMKSSAFRGCQKLASITIPDYTLTEIPAYAFYECGSLQTATIPKGAISIGDYAFANNPQLNSVTIPQTVQEISDNAFSYPSITSIYGCSGSFAETFAVEGGFHFEAIDTPAIGFAPANVSDDIILDRYDNISLQFDVLPEDSTDIITLSANNNNVRLDRLTLFGNYSGDSVVTASTTSGLECDLFVHVRTPVQLVIAQEPNKLSYLLGEELQLDGLQIELLYDDQTKVPIESYTVTGFDSSHAGECQVEFSTSHPYQDFSATLAVEIVDPRPQLETIRIDKLPDKLVYIRGEALNLTGCQVVGTYSDHTEEVINEYQISGFNTLRNGQQEITVAHGDAEATFQVQVVPQAIQEIEIVALPVKTEYKVGETLDLEGLSLSVTYPDGSSGELFVCEVSEFDTTVPGQKEIVLSACGVEVSLFVTVVDPDASDHSLSGIVRSYGEADIVSILLLDANSGTLLKEHQISKTTGETEYTITDIPDGEYCVQFSKNHHVTREYSVIIDGSNSMLQAEIWLKGDVTGDGKITTVDFARVNSHVREISLLSGYPLLCADVIGTDGNVTTADASRINAHARGTALLW